MKERPENLGPDDQESEQPELAPAASALALRIRRLKAAALAAVEKRDRVPQPMFWSVFKHELAQIKRDKESERLVAQALRPNETDQYLDES